VPELPEAETIVRGLRLTIPGKRIERVLVLKPDILRQPGPEFRARLRGRTVESVERRAKNILIGLDAGVVLVVNLGMTGRLRPFPRPPRGPARPSHPAVRFALSGGGVLFYDDVRRFGRVEALTVAEWTTRSAGFGPEPLESSYTAEELHEACLKSRSPIRSWLLDQKRIAGVGNIYANEALFLAGVRPDRPARTLVYREAQALLGSLREVLERAIAAGGTTLRDYRDSSGREGSFGRELSVYGRENEPCLTCGAGIERIVISNRSAFLCATCQPEETIGSSVPDDKRRRPLQTPRIGEF